MLFTRKFFEALGLPDLYKLRGSTGSGRLHQNLLPASHRTKPNTCHKLNRLKDEENGVFLLTAQEVQGLKELYKITDLEERGSRNLGNTGITMYITDNKYYIKK